PALRFAKAVPLPLWVLGAGLFLAKSETVAKGAATLQEKIGDVSSKATSSVGDAVSSASQTISEAGERAGSAAASASNQVGDVVQSAGGSLRQVADKAIDATAQMFASASEAASGTVEKMTSLGRDAAQSTQSTLSDAAHAARDTVSDVGNRATSTFFRTLEENPLLVAGVGLFIGGVIASALPRSELEEELMGEAARSAKQRAQAAADRGINAVSDAAREGVRHAAQKAGAEGLDADGINEAVRDAGRRVRRVAEAAVTTAFEPPGENEQPGVNGGRENGRPGIIEPVTKQSPKP
ncbi:MAG: hypothetical protein JO141_03510, partial [Bradyrhizobium sp.]|nr:hypothetical protein [Bradyrhizobium sp.]